MMDNQGSNIKFGTDGWRAVIAEEFTFANVRKVARACADYMKHKGLRKVVVGYDTRFLSDRFAQEAAWVLKDEGLYVVLSKAPTPTPVISFTAKYKRFDLGIMITASHNPAEFNGLKIKTSKGAAAGVELTEEIEKRLKRASAKHKIGKASRAGGGELIRKNLDSDYVSFLRSYVRLEKLKRARLKVLVDIMYGSGAHYIQQILKDTGIKIEFIHDKINPSFGGLNPEPIEKNLKELSLRMRKGDFDIGLALDGDADRIACVTPGDCFVNPQKILPLLLLHLSQDLGWKGGVVKTIVGSMLIDKVAKKLGLSVYETPIGFKYISELMQKRNILIGGEEAGGIGFKGYIPERDGTLAGILLLQMLILRKQPILEIIKEMEREFGRFYYLREDRRLTTNYFSGGESTRLQIPEFPKRLLGKKIVEVKDYDGVKFICEDSSWLMFRKSGTEPLIRLYSEAGTLKKAKDLIGEGRRLLKLDKLSSL